MTKIPLLDLFYQLRDTGLPLTIDQYYLAVEALEKSTEAQLDFIADELAVKQLCRIVWVKSLEQKKLFDECWEDWKRLESKSPVSQSTLAEAQREQQPTPPEQEDRNNNLDNTAVEPEQDSQDEEGEEVSTSIAPQNLNIGTAIKLKQSSQKLFPRNYLPVSRRKLKEIGVKLRQKSAEAIPSQLDIEATVIDVAKRGFFKEPILTGERRSPQAPSFHGGVTVTPAQTKEKEVILLIDREGSMAPFHPFCRLLVNTCQSARVYYFHNSPTDELYCDPKCWDGRSIKSILKNFSFEDTLVIIFSDAGAARQRSVYSRYEETYDFLERLLPKVQRLAWLNPLPRFRWQDNTAEEIAKINPQVPMFALESGEEPQMLEWLLYGKPSLKKFLKNANKKAKEESLKHQFDSSNSWSKGFDATGRIKFFQEKFGEPHLDFAAHAAFPLVLTPDLLYYLWHNKYVIRNSPSKNPEVPWYAVADLLLSDLCQQVYSSSDEEELYEMSREVREELLKHCQEKFGEQTLKELSEFLKNYIQLQLKQQSLKKSSSSQLRELSEVLQWTALAYTEPSEAAEALAEKLQQAFSQNNKPELVRLSQVTETFVEPLKDYQPLVVVARGYADVARGDEAGAKASENELKQDYSSDLVNDQISVSGVLLELPDIKKIRLSKFSFEVVTVNRRGEIIKREPKQARYFTEDLGNGITLDMVEIPGGKFMMGSPEGEGRDNEKPQHEVTVQPFFMGKFPLTQAQWREIASLPKVERDLKPDPSRFKGDERPVEKVSWYDAVEYCQRLSRQTGKEYRLPSEAEWEYACRAGTTTPFHFGETITGELANYRASETYASEPKGEYREQTTPVGQFPPNAFGLYDMHGNVWEWCADAWHKNYEGAPTDGSAWTEGDNDNRSLVRGGSWLDNPNNCRSAYRNNNIRERDNINNNVGFRVVLGVGSTLLCQS